MHIASGGSHNHKDLDLYKKKQAYLSNDEDSGSSIMERNYLHYRSETPGPDWLNRGKEQVDVSPRRSKTPNWNASATTLSTPSASKSKRDAASPKWTPTNQ